MLHQVTIDPRDLPVSASLVLGLRTLCLAFFFNLSEARTQVLMLVRQALYELRPIPVLGLEFQETMQGHLHLLCSWSIAKGSGPALHVTLALVKHSHRKGSNVPAAEKAVARETSERTLAF